MSLTVHNASSWLYDDIDWPNVMACVRRYADLFPHDVTVESLLRDLRDGRLILWLVRDDDRTVAVVLVALQTIDATGWKRAVIHAYVGEQGMEALPLLGEIEDWARRSGCDEIEVFGRTGWRRALAPMGYAEDATILRKRL